MLNKSTESQDSFGLNIEKALGADSEIQRPKRSKDNPMKAVIFMNLFALCSVGMSVVFKLAVA